MSDEVDVANDYAERELADRLYRRVQYQGESARQCDECDECDAEIPQKRREAVPGVRLCLDCQSISEVRRG